MSCCDNCVSCFLNGYLGEFGFFVYEGHDVHGFDCDQVQGVLVVDELDVLPTDALCVVFFLFQFENVPHKELLQVFVGVVDAKLFKTD